MTRQEHAICKLWDSLREKKPLAADDKLMADLTRHYRKTYNDEITPSDILSALEARANQ